MKIKKVFWILSSILALTLSACASSSAPTAIPTVSLDTASQPSSSSGNASSSAIVVPVKKIELSFPLSGAVKTVEVAAGASVAAGQPLVTLETAILEAKVKEAEANVVTVQTQLTYLKRTGTSQERLDAAQANIDRAQAAVDIAKAQFAQATLLAPFDGTIASVEISPAEFANPGQIVIVMGDLSHFQIETTDMSEKDVPALKVGQTASVFIEALGENFSGTLVDIARFSETVGGDVVFKVTIELDDQPEGLRWGMSAEVNIETK
ncbi:MAG: efflux RND transporter periplasmic adaptor subunit [Anaerolineales bacterium]|nr:efflux RND transporter periplasmic adaptor subunit [Anaerolineales bacterium]